MEARKKRTALRSHIEEIKQWVEQNKYDEWIADALGTSPSSIQSFRSRQGISRRSSSGHGEGATQEGPVSAFEGVLDHGDQDGWGLWFDPAVAEDPIWREHWRGVDSVAVRISKDAIVLEPQESDGPSSENPEPQTTLEASAQLLDGEGGTFERGRIRWFDPEKGYGFITRPAHRRGPLCPSLRGTTRPQEPGLRARRPLRNRRQRPRPGGPQSQRCWSEREFTFRLTETGLPFLG